MIDIKAIKPVATGGGLTMPRVPEPRIGSKPIEPTPGVGDLFSSADRNSNQYLSKSEIDNAVTVLTKKFDALWGDLQSAGEALNSRRSAVIEKTPKLKALSDQLSEMSPEDAGYARLKRQFTNKVERVLSKDPDYQALVKDADTLIEDANQLGKSVEKLSLAQTKFKAYAGADNRLSRDEFERATDNINLPNPKDPQ